MSNPAMPHRASIAALALLLSACGGTDEDARRLEPLDAELARGQSANAADPALMAALHDPIMVDPMLSAQANGDAVRPPTRPLSGMIPREDIAAGSSYRGEMLPAAPQPVAVDGDCPQCAASAKAMTLDALAANQPGAQARRCAATLRYSADWARRLPAGAPLFPDARVIEAAGSDAAGCKLRAVSFYTATPMATLIDWYHAQATRAGYASTHWIDGAQHILTGAREGDGANIVVFFNPRDDGTAIDLITAKGV